MISDNSMAFFGSLDNYAFGNEIKKFLYKYDVKPIYLSNTNTPFILEIFIILTF